MGSLPEDVKGPLALAVRSFAAGFLVMFGVVVLAAVLAVFVATFLYALQSMGVSAPFVMLAVA